MYKRQAEVERVLREHPAVALAAVVGLPHADWGQQVAAAVVLRLRNIQHLLTLIAGRLRQPGDGALQLARRLHPTPAMGGVPPERALAFLRHACLLYTSPQWRLLLVAPLPPPCKKKGSTRR